MVPEARMERSEAGLVAASEGWFVVNVREAAWVSGSVLLVSGGAVMTSDPYRYLMRVNKDVT